jgi:hypothetical protein
MPNTQSHATYRRGRASRRALLAAALSAAGAGLLGCRLGHAPADGVTTPPGATSAGGTPPLGTPEPAGVSTEPSPIARENQLTGAPDWQFERTPEPIPFGLYLSHSSISGGERLNVFASARSATSCRLEVFRLGSYGGAGARRVLLQDGVRIPNQGWWLPADGLRDAPAAAYDAATGHLDCNWAPVASISTSTDWVSGYYAVRLTDTAGTRCGGMFVLRNDARPGKMIVLIPTFTHQAYNVWGGKSLYDYNTTNIAFLFGHTRAVKVSFNRPYDRAYGIKQEILDDAEPQFVQWVEGQGYDVSYCTDADLHRRPDLLQQSNALLVVGHAEYWTHRMLSHTISLRDAGKHLAFLGGNDIYWQIRTEADSNGHSDRTVVCYKNAADDPRGGDPSAATVRFVDPAVGFPQSVVTGTVYGSELLPYAQDWIVARDHWLLSGTHLRSGDRIKGLVGREYDCVGQAEFTPPGMETIAASPVTDAHGGRGTAGSTLYRWPSGALVFSAGTVYWSRALANGSPNYDWRVGRITANLLDRFLAGVTPTSSTLRMSGA